MSFWNPESSPYSIYYQGEQDGVEDTDSVFVLDADDYPIDWPEMKQRAVERDNASCERCGGHVSVEDELYVVLITDPRQHEFLSVEFFETRCGDCTPDEAINTSALVLPDEIPRDFVDGEGYETTSDACGPGERYWFDTSGIDPVGFFGGPTFYLKAGKVLSGILGVVVGVSLLAGFAGAVVSGSSAGVSNAMSVLSVVGGFASLFLNPVVFAVTFSVVYGLHLLDRDYRRPWRFYRAVPESSGSYWVRLAGVSGLLAVIGFAGIATFDSGLLHGAGVGLMYAFVGVFAARELDYSILVDLDLFEMDVRAWLYAWVLRVGVFLSVFVSFGLLSVSPRVYALLVAVAPLTGFLYVTMRFASYRFSEPADTDSREECDGRVELVASMHEYHEPITSDSDSVTTVSAWINSTCRELSRFMYRFRNNDRLDSYTITHGKY